MAGYEREIAHRIFANELRNTDVVLEKDENNPYAVQYVVTPTGAKANRVFIIGALTEIEDIGTDAEYWRARIQDPTGAFVAYAGQYQIDAARTLSQVEIPAILAVMGKISVYMPDDGGTVLSIRPETVAIVDEAARDRWIYHTAEQTLTRIRTLEASNPEAIADMKRYRQMVRGSFEGMVLNE